MSGLREGISVIVRTVGRATLDAALQSVQAQQIAALELIVVDARGDVADRAAPVAGTRWVGSGRPLRRVEAAQLGLDAVCTRWALFLDDDDRLLPGHLRKLASALEASADAVLAHTGVEVMGGELGNEHRGGFDEAFEPWELLVGNRMPIHAALFDVRRVRDAGVAFDATFEVYEDWDFWLQLAELGRFVHVPGVSARYHMHAAQSAAQRTAHGDEPYWRIWRKWWTRAPAGWWAEALRQRQVVVESKTLIAEERQARDALRKALQQRIDALQQRICDLEQSVRDGAIRIEQLRVAAADADVQRRCLADALSDVQASLSWRGTKPLRLIEDKARAARLHAGRWRRTLGRSPGTAAYRDWIETVEAAEHAQRRALVAPLLEGDAPRWSVLMPVFNPQLPWLDEAIDSLRGQSWPHWQLCIADDASTAPGVREHLRAWAARDARIVVVERECNGRIAAATNSALALACGTWVCFLDQDDRLSSDALAECSLALLASPQVQLLFTDEDKLDAQGRRFEPHRKADFSVERLRGQNYLGHLMAMPRERLQALGGLRDGFDGAQDHELLLRASEGLGPSQVLHVPRILYHWRCTAQSTSASPAHKPHALQASWRAVNESLRRQEPGAHAEGLPRQFWIRVRYPLPVPRPAVGEHAALRWVPGRGMATDLRPACSDELTSLVCRPGVGVVGGAIVDARGRVVDGARECDDEGRWHFISAAFGRRLMVQDAVSLPAACLMMRAELWPLWIDAGGLDGADRDATMPAFCESVRAAGWRVLWSPFARCRGPGPGA